LSLGLDGATTPVGHSSCHESSNKEATVSDEEREQQTEETAEDAEEMKDASETEGETISPKIEGGDMEG